LAIAAAMGLAIFVIWWLTSPRSSRNQAPASPPSTTEPTPAAVEIRLPRGGSLTGVPDDFVEASTWLTQATLVRVNRSTDRVEPWLGESWSASADNLIYTLKLRPGVLWSDGTPLSAEDVIATVASVPVLGKTLAARTIDPVTIEIRFPGPFAPGLRVLDRYPVRARHRPATDVGLGPFVPAFAKAPAGKPSGRVLVRNPHYWRTSPDGSRLPYLDELTLAPGRVDSTDFFDRAIPVDEYEELKKLEQSGKARLFDLGPGLDADALWFAPAFGKATADKPASPSEAAAEETKQDKPWLADERFRLAISAAVDRRQYCKQVFFGACDPIAGPVTPANTAWFNPDLPLGRGDPQIAREMLAELGLRDRSGDGMLDDAARRSVRFSLLIRNTVPSAARAAAFLKETLRSVGVDVIVAEVDPNVLTARRAKGNYEAIYDRIAFRDTDPALSLDFWLSSGEAHVWKPVRRSPPADWERQIDQLMLKNTSTFDRAERLQAFVDVQRIYNQHMPALFFGAPHVRIFTSPRVLNATPSPLRPHILWNAESLAANVF
jgi:peptide/nickel transport system substrate-binding protein